MPLDIYSYYRYLSDSGAVMNNIDEIIVNGTPVTDCDDVISRADTLKPYETLKDDDVISVWLIRKNIEQQKCVQPKTKNYQQMWEDVKKYLYSEMKAFNKGVMCSLAESIVGENICKNFLEKMEEVERVKNETDN